MGGVFVYPPFPAAPIEEVLTEQDYAFPTRPTDYFTEIAQSRRDGLGFPAVFGRNPDIDIGSTPEDVWPGGGIYPGFDATANDELAIASSSGSDTGTDVSTGLATGGSTFTLEDVLATFITDGVVVGDCLVNETQSAHGIVSALTETEITVHRMDGSNPNDVITNESGDDYRLVSSTGTGAALIKVRLILDEDFVSQPDIYVTMNGTTTVTTSGVNAMRCTLSQVILAGSIETNVGLITINQALTPTNIFTLIVALEGQSALMMFTIPAGIKVILKNILITLSRQSGGNGSGTVAIYLRPIGEAFRAGRTYELTNGFPIDSYERGGFTLHGKTDVKMHVNDVSDGSTIVQGSLSYIAETLP